MSLDAASWVNNLYTLPAEAPRGAAAVEAWGRNAANGATAAAAELGQAGLRMTRSFESEYQPYDRKFMGHVDNIGSESYRSAQRGKAMSDIGMQTANAMMAANRNMARMGVDPTSGAAMRMNGLMAQQTALAKVNAAAQADRSSRDEWTKGLGAINAMSKNLGEFANKTNASALGYGDLAMKALGSGVSLRNEEMRSAPTQSSVTYNQANDSRKLDLEEMRINKQHEADMARIAASLYGTNAQSAYQNGLLTLDGRRLDNAAEATKPGNVFLSQVGGNFATGIGNAVGNSFKSWISQPRSGSSGSASAPGFGEWGGDPSYYDTSFDYSGDFWI